MEFSMENNELYVDNIKPSTLENIDFALFNWVDKEINPNCNTNEGFKKVPIIWSSTERAYQIKNFKDLRDKDGTLVTPFISIERGAITKNPSNTRSAFQANVKGFDRITFSRIINDEKTSKYASNDAYRFQKKINFALNATPKVVYQTKSMRVPTYIDVDYTISIKTSFLQQINEILQPFIGFTRGNKHFLIKNEGFQYEAFIGDSYEVEEGATAIESEERQYISKISVKVIGYLIGESTNQDDQMVITTENPVSIKLPRENIIIEEKKLAPKKRVLSFGNQIGDTAAALKKVFTIGDGINSVYTVNHNLKTRDMYVAIRENFGPDYAKVEVAFSYLNLNAISIDMGDIISEDSYVVTIIG
jgi:hypothetical protein